MLKLAAPILIAAMLHGLVEDFFQRLIEQMRQQVRLPPQLFEAIAFVAAERLGMEAVPIEARAQLLECKKDVAFAQLAFSLRQKSMAVRRRGRGIRCFGASQIGTK